MVAYHIANNASWCTLDGGFKAALPRYYRDRIFSPEQREMLNTQAQIEHWASYHKKVDNDGGVIKHREKQKERSYWDRQKIITKTQNDIGTI